MPSEAKGAAERVSALVVALAAGLLALGCGTFLVLDRLERGTALWFDEWSDPAVLALLALFALGFALAAWKRPSIAALAFAALAWSLGAVALCELPELPSSYEFGGGPWLAPLLLVATGIALSYALLSRDELPVRAAALACLWTAANGKLWAREHDFAYPLLGVAAALAFAAGGGGAALGRAWRGAGRAVLAIALAFALWMLIAAWLGEQRGTSLNAWSRLVAGALLGLVIFEAARGPAGARRTWQAWLLGALLVAFVIALALAESASFEGWKRVLGSRLRILGMHPNGIGPYFASALCLLAAECARRAALPKRNWLALASAAALAVLFALALVKTQSRASLLGAAVGLALFGLAWRAPLPRKPLRVGIALLAAGAAAIGFLVSPLSAPIHAKLAALAQTQSAWGQRYHFWRMALAALREHPCFGLGPEVFSAHARYAEPSFYDGTSQTLHTHDLPLAIAEGAGWPALALFALLLLASLEVARRALVRASEQPEARASRAEVAGVLASLAAILASNLLDLGQSQSTFLPLLSWTALGWLAARASAAPLAAAGAREAGEPEPRAARIAPLLALGLLALHALPLTAAALARAGSSALLEGDTATAEARLEAALACWPFDVDPHTGLARIARQRGDAERELQHLLALRDARPSRAGEGLEYGRALLALRRLDEARAAFERALAADPRGPTASRAEAQLACVELAQGQREAAEARILAALRSDDDAWRSITQGRIAAKGDAPGAAPRIAFPLGDARHPSGWIEFAPLLERLEQEALALVASDLPRALDLAARAASAWDSLGQPERALATLDRMRAAAGPLNLSFDVLRIEFLTRAGRVDEVRSAYEHSVVPTYPFGAALLARSYLTDQRPELAQAARALLPAFSQLDGGDVFFEAGLMRDFHALRARLLLGEDPAAALGALRRARYDTEQPRARVELALELLARSRAAGASAATLRALLRSAVEDAGSDAGLARDQGLAQAIASAFAAAWPAEEGSALEAARAELAHAGRAGAGVLRALERPPATR